MSEKQHTDAVSLIKEIIEKWCPESCKNDTMNNKVYRALFELNAYALNVEQITKGEDPIRTSFPQDLPIKDEHLLPYTREMENTLNTVLSFCDAQYPLNAVIYENQVTVGDLIRKTLKIEHGKEEGDTCNREGCKGTIEITQETCYCSATSHPPCGACESSWLECNGCGWVEEE